MRWRGRTKERERDGEEEETAPCVQTESEVKATAGRRLAERCDQHRDEETKGK